MALTLDGDGITVANLTSAAKGELKSGRKNLIINGDMAIWQRGTSQTTTGYGCVDRFRNTAAGTTTYSQETADVPSGFAYALKWTTGAASSYGQVRQFFETENVKKFRGNTVKATAYVKVSSTYAGNITWEAASSTTGDTAGATYTQITETNVVVANSGNASSSYLRISCDIAVPSDAIGFYLGIVPSVVQASGEWVSITGLQLELGDTATDFEHRSYGEELALCQRYYEKIFYNHVGQFMNTGNTQIGVTFSVSKRVSPTVSSSGTIGYSNGSSNYTNATFNTSYYANANNVDVRLNVPSGGFSAQSAVLINNQALSGFLKIDAEL